MSSGGFQESNTIARPRVVGRILRLGLGTFILFTFVQFIINFDFVIRTEIPHPAYWIIPAVAFWVLPDVVNIFLGRSWGRRPQLAVAALGVVIALVGFIVEGAIWSLPLAWFVYLLGQLVFFPLGVSFVLAAVLVAPG